MKRRVRKAWRQFRYPAGIHAWRWRFLGLWLVVFTVIVAWSLNSQRQQTRERTTANRAQIRILRRGLDEACHATTAQLGAIAVMILYISGGPDARSYRATSAVNALEGYVTDLGQMTACDQITRP